MLSNRNLFILAVVATIAPMTGLFFLNPCQMITVLIPDMPQPTFTDAQLTERGTRMLFIGMSDIRVCPFFQT